MKSLATGADAHRQVDGDKIGAVQRSVTVAIPTLNAGPAFAETLAAVRAQRMDREFQVLICDSGSSDETLAIARAHDAQVVEIPRETFSHGGTRNLLMSRAGAITSPF